MGFGIKLRRLVVFAVVGTLSAYPPGTGFVFGDRSAAARLWNLNQAQAATLVETRFLRIEKEDTLSQALENHFPDRGWRLWGKNGAIAKIAAKNPGIKDVNRLRPGMMIDIGEYAESGSVIQQRSPAAANEEPDSKSPPSTPAAVPTPTPALSIKAETSPTADEQYSSVKVAPEFSFSRIDAVDKGNGGSALFISNLTPGFRLSWGQHWSKRLQTSFDLGIRFESFTAPPGVQLNNATHSNADFGFGLKWNPLAGIPRLAVQSGLSVRTVYFVQSESLSVTRLDSAVIPGLTLGLRYRALEISSFSTVLHAQGTILFASSLSNFTIQAGNSVKTGVALTQNLSKRYQISGDFWYQQLAQDSSIATHSRTDLGLTFGLNIRFDPVTDPEELKRGDLP